MADFTIRWRNDEKRFEYPLIRAELSERGDEADLPFDIDPIEYDPTGIIELIPDEASTPTLAIFRAELKSELLKDKDFYRKVSQPVRVTITAHPAANVAQTASLVLADSGTVSRSCTVSVEPPPAQIHWRMKDLDSAAPINLALDDQVIEVEGDGQHTIELEVWLERYLPKEGRVGPDDTVHFSHLTGDTMRPRIFGPHPDSVPSVVARAGSGNRRTKSLWKSNAWLPDTRHAERVPMIGSIVVKAWEGDDIIDRPGANMIRLREGATPISEHSVPLRLIPIRISGTRLLPTDPIPADGLPHEVTLRFTRARTGRLLSNAQVSWELRNGDDYPGGLVDPADKWLTVDDGGHVKITYAPPALTYRPGGCYEQPLRLFSGSGEHRDEASPDVALYVSPEVRARLLGDKEGLEFKLPYELTIPADAAPEEVVIHHGFKSLDGQIPDNHDVFDAHPNITVVGDGREFPILNETRTDASGTVRWTLPELRDGLAALPMGPRRRVVLEPYIQEKPGDFDMDSSRVAKTFRSYLGDPKIASTIDRLLYSALKTEIRDQPRAMARQLAEKPRDQFEKARHGTDLVLTASRGTVIADGIHAKLFDQGLDMGVKFAVDLADYLIRAYRLGDELLTWLGSTRLVKGLAFAGGWLISSLRQLLPMLTARMPSIAALVERVIGAASGGASGLLASLANLVRQSLAMMATLVDNLFLQMEALAIQSLHPGKHLSEGAYYTAKKFTERAMKELSKALAQFYAGKGPLHDIIDRLTLGHTTKGDAYRDSKDWIRSNFPTGMSGAAAEAMGATTGKVSAFQFPYSTAAIPNYNTAMNALDSRNATFGGSMAAVDSMVSNFSTLCDVLAAVAVICTVVSLGTAAPISFAALSALGALKLQINVSVHLLEAFTLLAFAYYAIGAYRELTVELTKEVP